MNSVNLYYPALLRRLQAFDLSLLQIDAGLLSNRIEAVIIKILSPYHLASIGFDLQQTLIVLAKKIQVRPLPVHDLFKKSGLLFPETPRAIIAGAEIAIGYQYLFIIKLPR